MFKKWTTNGPSKTWRQKKTLKKTVVKKRSQQDLGSKKDSKRDPNMVFGWRPSAATPVGAAAFGCRAQFWPWKPKQNLCSYDPRFCWDLSRSLFNRLGHVILGSPKQQVPDHFFAILLLGPLRGHRPYNGQMQESNFMMRLVPEEAYRWRAECLELTARIVHGIVDELS